MDKRLIEDKWLVIPTILLFAYIIIRLIDQSAIINTFPLDTTNDWSSYITQAHFLKVCGFHNPCPYWYGGFTSFLLESPGWPFFVYPIDYILGNLTAANFIGLVITFILSLIALFKIGKKLQFSKLRSLFLFAFYFGNSVAIGEFIRLGRIKSAFGFMLGLLLLYFILEYKDRKLTKKFLLIIPIYAALVITHYQEAFLLSLLPICLLVYKRNYLERTIIILSLVIAVAITSFWSYPFLMDVLFNETGSLLGDNLSRVMFQYDQAMIPTLITSFLVSIAFIALFVLRLSGSKKRMDLFRFYSPMLLLALLFVSRIYTYVPFLRNISPDTIIMILLLFALIFLLELRGTSITLKKIAIAAIIIITIASITISHLHTPYFTKYTPMECELLDVLEHTPGSFLMFTDSHTSYAKAYYSLAAMKYNLTTPSGWYEAIAPQERLDKLVTLTPLIEERNCEKFKEEIKSMNTEYLIGYERYCNIFIGCGFKEIYNKGSACLIRL